MPAAGPVPEAAELCVVMTSRNRPMVSRALACLPQNWPHRPHRPHRHSTFLFKNKQRRSLANTNEARLILPSVAVNRTRVSITSPRLAMIFLHSPVLRSWFQG